MTRLCIIILLAVGSLAILPPSSDACPAAFYDVVNNACRISIVAGGGSGGTSSTFGSAFPSTGTALGFKDSGGVNMQPGNLDASGNVKVNMAGCAGCATDGSTFTPGTSATSSMGAVGSGTLKGLIFCDSVAKFNTASSGNTSLVSLISGKTIYICGWESSESTASATNVSLVYGTQTTTPCDTGTTTISDIVRFPAGVTGLQGKVSRAPFYNGMKSAASNAVCVNNSAAVQIDGLLYYTQF